MTPAPKTQSVQPKHGRNTCPNEAELMAFAEGKLPEPASDAIFRHVTLCVDCEDTLARLSDQTPRRCGGQPISTEEALLSEPECLRMQEAVRKFPLQLGRDQPQDASQQSTDSTRLSTGSPPPARARKAVGETTELLPATPHTIGRYEVRSILGEGSYGRVYLAHDPQLDRQVAVKVAKFGSDVRQEVIDAFLREAKVAAKLKHPGIVAVYDAGVDAKAGCFIVMEYVAGKSLKHLLKASKVSHESAARYVAQAAEALAYAHKLDLVHRDLKPANLLIDADDNVRVADFGLAIFEEEQRKHAGEFAGTLAYCSPEQIRGEVPHLDGRSDIWSLGVILYELLTGRRPFGGSSVAEEILHRPAKPPRQIDDSIPADLEQVCLKCLAKEASQRYPAAKDLAREVCHDVVPPRPVPWLWIAGLSSAAALVALVLLTPPLLGVWNSPGGSSEDSTGVQLAPETQEIPYLVDEAARPFVAWPLLTRPLKAPFEPAQRTERWELVDERDELWITTPTLFLVGLGETNLKDYRYHVDVTSNTPTADAGVFFGYHPAPPMEGKPAWRCHLLTVHNSPGRTVTTIKRHRALVVAAGDTFMLQPTTIAASDVPYATMRGASLEVTIGEGRLSEVRWLDRPLLDLTTDDLDHPDFPTTGEFGVIAYRGTMIFTDAQFTNHGR